MEDTHRFYELYRKSKKEYDNQIFVENDDVFDVSMSKEIVDLENVIFKIDVEMFLKKYVGKKQKIFRMRRRLYKEILDRHFI